MVSGGGESKKGQFIVDQKERMSKWKRRSESLVKRAWELSTLCNTPTCIVISPPTNEDGTPMNSSCCTEFAMWPDDKRVSLRRMIDLYNKAKPSKINNSPSVKARAIKKVKVVDNDVGQPTTSVSCGGGLGLPKIQTASGDNKNVELVEEVSSSNSLEAVNAPTDQIQTSFYRDDFLCYLQ